MKLSVCIVTYNHERYIRQCIESALRQDVPFDYEIVIGEDRSTDGTLGIVEELASQNPDKIRVMGRPRNLGAEENFNTTISECRGEYIAFLEGDNYWISSEKLRKQTELLDDHPDVAFCFHRAVYVDEFGERTSVKVPSKDPPQKSRLPFLLQDFNPVPLGSMLVRRDLLDRIEEWVSGLMIGDWPICMMLANQGSIGFIPEDMSIQRVHKHGTWQLLPDDVKLVHMLRALDHVKPRLGHTYQTLIAAKIRQFEGILIERLEELSSQQSAPGGDGDRNTAALMSPANQIVSRYRILSLIEAVRRSIELNENLERLESDPTSRPGLLQELARVRRRPLKAYGDLLKFRILKYLLKKERHFDPRRVQRFRTSAAKRDPDRTLFGTSAESSVSSAQARSGFWHVKGHETHEPSKQNVILASHEFSRTGAPILGLNIAQSLKRHFNVTIISLRDGPLLEAFREVATDVFTAKKISYDGRAYRGDLLNQCAEREYAFAIVNSMESRGILMGLHDAGVPVVSLVHEFSSYTNPKTAILDVLKYSKETVFSTSVTLDDALNETGMSRKPKIHILPQGKCVVPAGKRDDEESEAEIARLKHLLRPETDEDRKFVVVGAATVEMRKGTDLFFEVATRVLSQPDGDRFRFAWIGKGYDPERDFGYSVYLKDQLHRAGIEDRVVMVGETAEIETAYRLSDVFCLSSRLDPLPNVAIDSLWAERPVVCFDRTGGIPEILTEHGLGANCVARYLDTSDMADKIISLARSREVYDEIAARSRDVASRVFDLDGYVDNLCALATRTTHEVGKAAGSGSSVGKQSAERSGSDGRHENRTTTSSGTI